MCRAKRAIIMYLPGEIEKRVVEKDNWNKTHKISLLLQHGLKLRQFTGDIQDRAIAVLNNYKTESTPKRLKKSIQIELSCINPPTKLIINTLNLVEFSVLVRWWLKITFRR